MNHSARKRTVADHSDRVRVGATNPVGVSETERGGERGRTVPCAEAIAFAFLSPRESTDPARLAEGFKLCRTPGKELMDIALMSDVPDNMVAGAVKYPMNGDGQFHHAEIGRKMPAVFRNGLQEKRTRFLCKLRQQIGRNTLEIIRRISRK